MGAKLKLRFVPQTKTTVMHYGPGRRRVAKAGEVVEVDRALALLTIDKVPGEDGRPSLMPDVVEGRTPEDRYRKNEERARVLYEWIHGVPPEVRQPKSTTPPPAAAPVVVKAPAMIEKTPAVIEAPVMTKAPVVETKVPVVEKAPLADRLAALSDEVLKDLNRDLGGLHRSRETRIAFLLEGDVFAVETALARIALRSA